MKSLFILILCGLACCFALPKCSEDEIINCFKYNFTIDVTEEIMEKYCDQVQCMNEVFGRCGNPDLSYDAYRHTKEVYDTFCPKINPFRKKFMDHIRCIFRYTDEILEFCKPVPDHINDHEEFCRMLSTQIKCSKQLITRRCSLSATEVAEKLSPSLKHYNCPE